MSLRRRIETLGPPLLAAAAIAVLVAPAVAGPPRARTVGPGPIRAASGSAALPACPPAPRPEPASGTAATLVGAAWYRLDPVLDDAGGLDGQRLFVGRVGRRGAFELPLGVESFASGPARGRILVGNDDGRRSTLRILDVARRCASVVQEGPDLIRRAVFDPSGDGIVEFRLDRSSRADLGVWNRPLDGTKPRRLLEPLAPNSRIGRVFATELSWSADGKRLVVTSCGETFCLARILDRSSGRVTTIDDHRVGQAIGVVGDELVAYGGCPWLPCEIVAMNLKTGRVRDLASVAGLATLHVTDAGAVVAFEDFELRGTLRVVDLDGKALRTIPLETGLRLVPASGRALAGFDLPAGVIALAKGSRPSRSFVPATFINIADGRRVPAAEVVR
jgi:hypothetical protein